MKKIILTVVVLFLGITALFAQSGITASGGEASGSAGTVSYSAGQVAYQTYTGTNGSVAQGVQQAYEISVVTGIKESKDINLTVSAYPNPTTDYITLSINEFDVSNLSFQLYSMHGKLLQNPKITDKQTRLVMSHLVPAIYFVKVIHKNKEVKTFKIIKK